MLIDWFTVGAQIVNFLILVWLLKRFLYKPILSAMEERERNIDANLQAAAATKAEAEQARLAFLQQNQELEGRRLDLLKQAQAAADKEYQDLLEEKRNEVLARQEEWHKSLAAQQETFIAELESKAQTELLAIARQVLADLAGADVVERMVAIFIRQLQEAFKEEKTGVAAMVFDGTGPVAFRSSAPLPESARQALLDCLRQAAGRDIPAVFEDSPQLVAGIEMVAGGQKLSWTFAGYLLSLRRSMEQILERNQDHGSRE